MSDDSDAVSLKFIKDSMEAIQYQVTKNKLQLEMLSFYLKNFMLNQQEDTKIKQMNDQIKILKSHERRL